jgi:hypothetical protein
MCRHQIIEYESAMSFYDSQRGMTISRPLPTLFKADFQMPRGDNSVYIFLPGGVRVKCLLRLLLFIVLQPV